MTNSVKWLMMGVLSLLLLPGPTQAKCEVRRVAALPITMEQLRPLLTAKINGRDASFIIDSGAFYSMIPASIATQYALPTRAAPFGFYVTGIGGRTSAQVATVKEFTLLDSALKNVEFLVGGSDTGYAGLLGQNLLENYDVEYDFAHGLINLFKTKDCSKVQLAYWVQPGQEYSTMSIDHVEPMRPHTIGSGMLNGQSIRVMFDSGAYTSVLSLHAASRAGVKPDSPGVTDGGVSRGLGRDTLRSYIAVFDSFKIGDGEEIKHAKLRFADLGELDADMLLGADFFVSHHILVGNREHRLFLTYNGGAVFDLSRHAQPAASTDSGSAGPVEPPATDTNLTDPAELARRGSALAARRDFPPALADLSRAVELAPGDPEYYYQRANAYLGNGEGDKALADLNHVIELKHDFLPAYTPRAELKLAQKDRAGALADLDAVDSLAPAGADLRLTVGRMYQSMARFPAAIEQYTQWITSHPEDSRLPEARLHRCLSEALQNLYLKRAQDDCDYAVRRFDRKSKAYTDALADRGMVRLRAGELDRALGDFNDVLKVVPENALALYGRAVIEGHRSHAADADRDLAQARKLNPEMAARLEQFGFVP